MLVINFKKVILHCFGAYEHAEIDLQNKGYCLVSGQNNYTKDNAASNGSGKSFIWSGICYALTGETIGGISKDLKNRYLPDEPEMYVELSFTSDGHDYIIRRGQAKAKTATISKDGTDISGKTYTETLDKIASELPELTRDLIASTIILGQGMPNKFSSFSPSGRKELLEKLTKSDYMIEDMKTRVTERLNSLNTQLRSYDDSLLINNTQLKTVTTNLETVNTQINTAVKPDYDKAIADSEHRYNEIIKDRDAAKTKLTEAEKELENANAILLEANNHKAARLTQLNEAYHKAKDSIAARKTELEVQISALKAEITRLDNIKDICPTCGQKLVGVEKPDTSGKKVDLANLNKELETVVKPALAEKELTYQGHLKTIDNEVSEAITNSTKTIAESKRIINNLKNDINDFDHYATLENEKLIGLKYDRENWDNWFDNLKKTAAGYEAEIEKINKAVAITETGKADVQAHISVVKKMETLIKRDFRGYLLENIIAYIDQKAKEYSEIVYGTKDLNIYLDGNNLDISYDGRMMDNLSGGEKTRVDLILQLTIRNLLQNYLGFNSSILVLDEVTDFLDKQSCSAVMKLLEKELTTIESVFIISHHTDELELPIDSEIKVIKNSQGISEIFA